MRLARTLGLAAGLAMVGSMALAGGAIAKPIEHTDFHDEFTEVVDDFCEVPDLMVQVDVVVDGRFLVNPHGPDGLAYFKTNLRVTNVYTNLDNGNTVTEVVNGVDKDLRVTDNGDGTLTILVLSTGNAAVFGPDGKALARNPGQVRFELLVDHGGTPSDPSDDEELEFLGLVKGSTGRTDDFCAAVVPVLEEA
ncbi:MAG: hypothetical protein ACRD0W_18735 [Acidimicrobiales bacterium]